MDRPPSPRAMPPAARNLGPLYAVLAAASFGAVAPLAKLFVGPETSLCLVAGLLHFGSGLGLVALLGARPLPWLPRGPLTAVPLGRAELPAMLVSILGSGVLAPFLLMWGLSLTRASTTALLLNLEGLATMAIAWLAFGERFESRLLGGAILVVAGSAVLGWRGDLAAAGGSAIDWGVLPVAAACAVWGLGNNFTRKLTAADPVQVTAIKGLCAGAINIALGVALGAGLPALPLAAGAGLVGFVAYGLSFVFFILALRQMGTARAGAYLSIGPFFGALLAIAAFGEPLTPQFTLASVLMALGVWLCRAQPKTRPAADPARSAAE